MTYNKGYLDGVMASSWTCFDCGNTYQASIEECPNIQIDEAKVKVRQEQYWEEFNDQPEEDKEGGSDRAALGGWLERLQQSFDPESRDTEKQEFEDTAQELGIEEPRIEVHACPLVVSGIYSGRFFYLRERHGEWRVTIAPDKDPLLNVWLETGGTDIAFGPDQDIYETDRNPLSAALWVAVREIDNHLDPDGGYYVDGWNRGYLAALEYAHSVVKAEPKHNTDGSRRSGKAVKRGIMTALKNQIDSRSQGPVIP